MTRIKFLAFSLFAFAVAVPTLSPQEVTAIQPASIQPAIIGRASLLSKRGGPVRGGSRRAGTRRPGMTLPRPEPSTPPVDWSTDPHTTDFWRHTKDSRKDWLDPSCDALRQFGCTGGVAKMVREKEYAQALGQRSPTGYYKLSGSHYAEVVGFKKDGGTKKIHVYRDRSWNTVPSSPWEHMEVSNPQLVWDDDDPETRRYHRHATVPRNFWHEKGCNALKDRRCIMGTLTMRKNTRGGLTPTGHHMAEGTHFAEVVGLNRSVHGSDRIQVYPDGSHWLVPPGPLNIAGKLQAAISRPHRRR